MVGRAGLACVKTAATFLLGFLLGGLLHAALLLVPPVPYDPQGRAGASGPSARWWDLTQLSAPSGGGVEGSAAAGAAARVLCYVLTGPATHHTAIHVKNTWGQRCDRMVFYSTAAEEGLEPEVLEVQEGYHHLWGKARAALGHLHQHYPQYDWYLKADDDTYVIVENLRYFLRGRDPNEPVYYGVKFRHKIKQGFMSGGGGYVLSREALRRTVTEALTLQDQGLCPTRSTTGPEDLQLGLCLESVGVAAGESLDDGGKPRFFAHNPLSLFFHQPLINRLHWYWRYLWHQHGVGPDCCSPHVVTFHDVDPRMMWTLETLLYRLTVHRDLQPAHLNTSTSTPSPTQTPPLSA